ncbi:hypothetical protein [Citrobacter freundii]|uniref:hypothetical protein n=1 Tax=Citrobacter freundii TaxID=546 RepID=UPI00397D2301
MTWGIQTWDANGVPNNYGIKPVTVVGIIDLALGQKTGSYQFNRKRRLSTVWSRIQDPVT